MSTTFLKQIKSDTSKLVDINSVLMKLNDKGHINQLASQFETIFQEEQSFTIQELTRLMKNLSKDRYFDMNMQFKMNTSIFKANFEVIVQIIMNNIWDKVTEQFLQQEDTLKNQQNGQQQDQKVVYQQENTEIQQQEQQQQQQQMQYDQVPIQQQQQQEVVVEDKQVIQQQQQQQSQQQQQQQQSPQQQQQQQKKQGLHQNHNSLQLSTYTTNSVINNSGLNNMQYGESWVRKSMKSGSTSIHQVNKSAVDLYEGRRSQVLTKQHHNNNVSLSQIKQKKSYANNTSKMSISSVRSVGSASKLGATVPFSELSQIHDSNIRSNSPGLNSSFSRAARDLNKSSADHSPGPSAYNVNRSSNVIRKSSPNTKFGKSARISWIDERLRYDSSVQTPGAKYDSIKVHTSKPLKKQ